MSFMVVFDGRWEEFRAWRYDPDHPERQDLDMVEACELFLQEEEA